MPEGQAKYALSRIFKLQAAKYVVETLAARAKAAKLKGFERISAVHLAPEPFSVDNDLMNAPRSS